MLQISPVLVYGNILGIALWGAVSPINIMTAECEKGSRDCFPQDRVGVVAEIAAQSRSHPALLRSA